LPSFSPAMPTLAALAILLAGCSGDGPGAAAAEAGPAEVVLRGVVVDAAIRPLSGATVVVVPGDLENTTGEDGAFSFTGLAEGDYTVTVRRAGYLDSVTTARAATADVAESVQVVLEFLPTATKFASLYKFEGMYECGVWPTNGCANVNIVTGIMLCQLPDPVPCFNATSDQSVFLQWVDPGMQFLQTELSWTPTLEVGKELGFGVGGANQQELQQGIAPGYNYTEGQSPLMVRMDWDLLNESRIGHERALLVQVGSGGSQAIPDCVVASPCGPTVQVQQTFTNFTTTFYGYLPPDDWLFSTSGQVPPPPA
jgi:hypothetical protein